ncbi:MAG: ABC transporter permease [Coriobacteriia bacterium]|nr:ABC transporter permease [Coriobacteriia bacterium]
MVAKFFSVTHGLMRQTWDNRAITWEFARRTLHKKYKGTALGMLWILALPMAYVLVFWFAIEIGLRMDRGDYPFVLWLIPGIFLWRTISECLSQAGNSVRKNRGLVTKVSFPLIAIPQFSVLSLFVAHMGVMLLAFAIFIAAGYTPTIYWLQFFYYIPAAFIFCLIAATFLSALTAFSKDLVQFIRVMTQTLFWFSPILWPASNLEGTLGVIMRLNPIAYLVEGYRACMLYNTWFWQDPGWALYFWAFIMISGVVTIYVWNRMSRNFADVM